MSAKSWSVALLSLFSLVASARAADTYCGIAFSPSTGVFGYSYNQRSAEAARSVAVKNCESRSRRRDAVSYTARNAWAALAVGKGNGYGWGWGTSKAIAEKHALQSCARHTTGGRIRMSLSSLYYNK